MSKKTKNIKLFRALVSASILVWVFVIIVTLLLLQVKGGLTPYAADNSEVSIVARGRVVNMEEMGIGGAKITLTNNGVNRYIYADSDGRFVITDVELGDYKVAIEARGYKTYATDFGFEGVGQYNFTLQK